MFIEVFLYAFTSLFVIVDPLGVGLIYLGLTKDISPPVARAMAIRGVAIAFSILVLFAFGGEYVLGQLGITTGAFRIAGGVFLFMAAYNMVTAKPNVGKKAAAERAEESNREDLSVFPLAMPLLAGPGAMTIMILLMAQATATESKIATLSALAVVQVIALVALFSGAQISKILGKAGVSILERVLGILLAALSVQWIADGIRNVFQF